MNMVKAIVYGFFGVLSLTLITMLTAGPFYDIMGAFDTVVTDLDISNLTTNWGRLSSTIKLAFWVTAILSISGLILWIYMRAQQKEYVTEGRRRYR